MKVQWKTEQNVWQTIFSSELPSHLSVCSAKEDWISAMPFDKERQIQAIRIFLTVFYGFLLPDPYLIRAIFYTIQRSEPFYIVWLMIDSAVRLIWVILVIYATW